MCDVDRASVEGQQRRQFLAGHRAQAVRGETEHRIVLALQRARAALQQLGKTIDIVDQPALGRVRRGATEIGMRIEHRQQGQADPAGTGGSGDALGHFGTVGVRRTVRPVMQIVELANPGEPGFQHLHIGLLGDRLHGLGLQMRQEAVHQLAPAPEAVPAVAADLGQPGHATLEGVAVQVAQARQGDGQRGITRLGRHPRGHLDQLAALAGDAHIARPALWQQCAGGVEGRGRQRIRHGWTTGKGRLYCIDISAQPCSPAHALRHPLDQRTPDDPAGRRPGRDRRCRTGQP